MSPKVRHLVQSWTLITITITITITGFLDLISELSSFERGVYPAILIGVAFSENLLAYEYKIWVRDMSPGITLPRDFAGSDCYMSRVTTTIPWILWVATLGCNVSAKFWWRSTSVDPRYYLRSGKCLVRKRPSFIDCSCFIGLPLDTWARPLKWYHPKF